MKRRKYPKYVNHLKQVLRFLSDDVAEVKRESNRNLQRLVRLQAIQCARKGVKT